MEELPWYKTFFGEDYLSIYAPVLPPERTASEIKGIIDLLALPPSSSILDLCCGHGRHAIPLAQHGFQVTGQDLSEKFLQRARADAESRGVEVRWVHSDMRQIPFESEFDAIINMFSAFGYLEDEYEDLRVLQQVHKALKPGGLFLLETVSREGVISNYGPYGVLHLPDGGMVIEERRFDQLTSRNIVQVTLFSGDGRRTEYSHAMRFYTLTELVRMLKTAGLHLHAYCGDINGNPLLLNSFRLVVIARKDADSA